MTDSPAVTELTILSAKSAKQKWGARRPALAEIKYCARSRSRKQAVEELYARLLGETSGKFYYDGEAANGSTSVHSGTEPAPHRNGHAKTKSVDSRSVCFI